MAAPKYQHTIQLPAELEELWLSYQSQHPEETFNGFVVKIIRQEMDLQCVTAAPTLTIP
jgi:hypothetical protein